MHKFSIEHKLEKKLVKILKKDKVLYNFIMSKIEETLDNKEVDHYKNLRKPLQDFIL